MKCFSNGQGGQGSGCIRRAACLRFGSWLLAQLHDAAKDAQVLFALWSMAWWLVPLRDAAAGCRCMVPLQGAGVGVLCVVERTFQMMHLVSMPAQFSIHV